MPARKDLPTLLSEENAIDAKEIERVARAARTEPGEPFWAALLESALMTEDELFFLLARRGGVVALADEILDGVNVPEPLRRTLTREQAMAAGVLPIDLSSDGRRVTLAMVDPTDDAAMESLRVRAGASEVRVMLGRRSALERAVERCLGEVTSIKAPPGAPTVKIDPEMQAEIQRLPSRILQADPLTPRPRPRPTPSPMPVPIAAVPTSEVTTANADARAEDRLSRTLSQAVEVLAGELELRVRADLSRVGDSGRVEESGRMGAPGATREMGRLARRVARQLGLDRRAADEIGVAAQLFALDRLMRRAEGAEAPDLFGEFGWSAAGEGGLLPTLRALTTASQGFGRAHGPGGAMGDRFGAVPVGARVIGAVADYLELSGDSPDLGTVSQLLRASPAGAPVVDALLRVLESERGDVTPQAAMPVAATSMLKEED